MPAGSSASVCSTRLCSPTNCRQSLELKKAQAIDAVADRHLVGGLGLPVAAHEFFGRQALVGQTMFEPAIGQRKVRILPLQMACQFGEKRAGQGRVGAGHVGQHQNQVGRLLLHDADHPLRPNRWPGRGRAGRRDADRDAAQILDRAPDRSMSGNAHSSPSLRGSTD